MSEYTIQSTRFSKIVKILESKEKKSYFVIALTTISITLIVIFGLLPSYSAVTLQFNENLKRNNLIELIQKKIDDLNTLSKDINDNALYIRLLKDFVSQGPNQENIINEILGLIDRSGVTLKSMSFNLDTKPSKRLEVYFVQQNLNSLGINIVIESNSSSYINFLKYLEDDNRFYDILNIVVARSSDVVKGDFYQVTIQCNYYYLQ